jgi:hypothetical protein
VTNACGSATTVPATLTVHPAGPEITGHPESLLLCVGETATFVVGAIGRMHGALEYQWMKDGLPIAGANAATLSFPVGGLFAAGSYLCRVTEPGCGSSDSSPAVLTVRNAAPVITLLGEAAVTMECGHGTHDAAGNMAYAFETVVCPNAQNQTALDGVQATALRVTAQLVAIANATESATEIDQTLTTLGFRRHGLEAENGPHQ